MVKMPKQIYVITKCIEDYCQESSGSCISGAAFAQAAHAKAMNRDVFIFLEASGVQWAFREYKPKIESSCFNPLEYFRCCLDNEIEISACKTCLTCTNLYCQFRDQDKNIQELIYPSIKISSFTELQCFLNEPCNIFTF